MELWVGYVVLSAVLLALSSIVRKHVLKHEHPLEELASEGPFWIIILLFLVPFVRALNWEEIVIIYLMSLVLVASFVYRNRAYRHLPISYVAPLQNLSPVILVVIAFLLLGEHPTVMQLMGVVLIMIGGYALELRGKDPLAPIRNLFQNKLRGVLLAFLILISFMGLLDKAVLSRTALEPLTYLFWLYLFFVVNTTCIEYARYKGKGVWQDIKKYPLWLFAVAALGFLNIFAFYSALAMPGVLVTLAIPIRRTATLIETILGGGLFHEDHIWQKAIGCAVMLAGVLLIV